MEHELLKKVAIFFAKESEVRSQFIDAEKKVYPIVKEVNQGVKTFVAS